MRSNMLGAVVVLMMLGLAFAPKKKEAYIIKGLAQGTTYQIMYYAHQEKVSAAEVEALFLRLDSSLSIYKPYSLINRFNASRKGVQLDQHLKVVVEKALKISEDTKGKFDITVYPLVKAWGFGSEYVENPPDSAQVEALLSCVGSEKLTLEKCFLKKKEACVQIDVNGIAQGYSVDVLADLLEKRGVKDYLVEVGGEMRVRGKKPDETLFRIGIEKPGTSGQLMLQSTLALKKGAITTSGNYRKFLTSGSQTFSHLLDPQTGYPVRGEMISVTVLAKDAMTADGYDNALMAMPLSEALNFVKQRKELEAYFIYRKGNGAVADTASAGFYKYLVK